MSTPTLTTTKQTCTSSFSLLSFKPPSPYLSTLSLLYISKTEYRRRQHQAVVFDQGLLRTVRRVDGVGETQVGSPPRPHPQLETALSCFSHCQLSFSVLSSISNNIPFPFSNNHRLSRISIARLSLFLQRQSRDKTGRTS